MLKTEMGKICGKNGRRSSSTLACQNQLSGHDDLARPKQRWKAQEKEALMDLNLTRDEDDGSNDDDDFGLNRPRIAATLRAFLLHFRKSRGKQAATRDTEKPETQ